MGGRSTLGRRPPRSRRTRLRPAPLASGRRTRDPASAASRTTLPSGRPDDLPADPSPQPDSDPLSPLNRVRPRPLRQRAVEAGTPENRDEISEPEGRGNRCLLPIRPPARLKAAGKVLFHLRRPRPFVQPTTG